MDQMYLLFVLPLFYISKENTKHQKKLLKTFTIDLFKEYSNDIATCK